MKIVLSPEEKQFLELKHSKEKDHRKADRIKSVLLRSEGWSLSKIAQALRLHNDTVSGYVSDYLNHNNLDFNYKGSKSQLNENQTTQLIKHLEENLYTKVIEIVDYIKSTFDVNYTVSGMTDWLKKHNFTYKSPKGTPSKADISKQKEFVEIYKQLKEVSAENDEPILFLDDVHPSMQTKISHGWIKKGKEMEISTTASRTRINILGAINLDNMNVITEDCGKSINSQSIIDFFDSIKKAYSEKRAIHVILDQAGYNRSFEVREYAFRLGIHLHYLPPYSPNLNSIERLWKVMNEDVRNNVFFESAKKFKMKIIQFFDDELPKLLPSLRSTINDKFHIKKTVN